ncbi:MAG: SDR family NAD(P)-dependent oxidoreductase [Candidatus Lokiarchaeota archaeon]|nr:SDR family NAD(P)-dependent oxidoreductase [Candidatus Lokiarchaeota archaeon]
MTVKTNFMDVEDPGVAVITGASSGIGESFARILSSQGFDLVITARRKNRLEDLSAELKQKHGINVKIMAGDLSRPEFMEEVSSHIEKINNLDVVVNNAGFGTLEDFISKNSNVNVFMTMLNLHCGVIVRLMHAGLKPMRNNDRGVIFNVSSIASLIFHGSREPMYHATKAFVSAFTEMAQLKLNFIKSKVKLKSICPGNTHTEIFGPASIATPSKFGEPMSPEEVVNIALNSYKNMDIIVITGDHNIEEVLEWRRVAYDKPGRYFSKEWSKSGLDKSF